MKNLVIILILKIGLSLSFGQGFINMNFESGSISMGTLPGAIVPTATALPGWNVYFGSATHGTNQLTQIWYDSILNGSGGVSIQDSNTLTSLKLPLEGRYSLVLEQARFAGDYSAIISQTGLIPVNTASMTFWGGMADNGVTFNGQILSLVVLGTTPNYYIYGADVSAYAGQTGELRFTASYGQFGTFSLLDNIQFSSSPIPEPSTLALGAMGALLFGFRRWRPDRQ